LPVPKMKLSHRILVVIVAFVVFLGAFGAGATLLIRHHPSLERQLDRIPLAVTVALARPNADVLALAAARARRDDWTTFAHDQRRSGFETAETGLTPSTVSHIRLRWMHELRTPATSSPIVVGGSVYVATTSGDVLALNAADGTQQWRVHVGASVHMTPAVVGDLLLVGDYGIHNRYGQKPSGASLVALETASGAVRWRTPLPGLIRSELVVLGSTIYEGLAGGDAFSGCFRGRVVTLDLKTGRKLPAQWFSIPGTRDNGGGVWAPLSTDGKQINVGTGNSCGHLGGDLYGDSIVGLDPHDLHLLWHVLDFVPGVDDSGVGGGVMILGNHAYAAGKTGYFYRVDRTTGKSTGRFDLKPWARNGGSKGTPTGDGTFVMISSGELTNPWTNSWERAGGDMVALDLDFHERYRLRSNYAIHGHASFVRGVGFTALDRRLVAFDSQNGTILWRGVLDDVAYASPAIVPSGVYIVTNSGSVFAYGLP
jgi:outer membrane protein assembly factor BamB